MEIVDTYKTIEKPSEGLYKDKGSKFIALAHPVESEEEIKEILAGIRKQYYDARHHCYAWVLDQHRERYRMNDDGEPSGTAGKPIYGQILSFDLTNILIVVIRYFGGTKLGVRGLINAYKGAAQLSLEQAEIATKVIHDFFELRFEYPAMNEVMKILKDHELQQHEHDFALSCRLVFSVRQSLTPVVKQAFKNLHEINIEYLHSR
jgi:uncharacterized YigZ family protein